MAAIVVWPVFGGVPQAVRADNVQSPQRGRWNSTTVRLITSYGLFGLGYIIPATFLPVIARDLLAGSQVYVWFWPACGIAAAISAFASVPLTRRYGDHALVMACFAAETVGVALPAFITHAAAIGVAAVLFGGTFLVITVACLREARVLAPAHASRLIAAMTAAFALGQIIGPLFAAYIVAWQGSFAPALLASAAALVVAAILLPRVG